MSLPREHKDNAKEEITSLEESDFVQNGSIENVSTVKQCFKKLVKAVEVQEPGELTMTEMFLYNPDLKPVEKARRVWRWYDYANFWIADALNINALQTASTGMVAGLTWWQTWISVWLGYFIAGCFVSATSRIGGSYHVSFPVACRSSFGPFGSIWPVINRVVMSIIWFAVQTWLMGQCVQVMLLSIFGLDLDTRMGTQNLSGTTTFKFVSFFIAWVIQLPFLWLEPHVLRHVFTAKTIVTPTAYLGYVIWMLVKAGSVGGVGAELRAPATIQGSKLAWAFVASTMNCIANFASLILNSADFTRFAVDRKASYRPHVYCIPISFALTTLIGILATAAGTVIWGKTYWSTLDILEGLLSGYSSGDRAGVFFITVGFLYAQIAHNLCANSVPAGLDLTAILPRFSTTRRGSFLCAFLALCLVPWNFFASSSKFTTYLSAYSIFLSSIAGVMICDYYWVRRGYIDLYALFSLKKNSLYNFGNCGVNWRAYVSYILGVVPTLPGFIRQTGRTEIPEGAQYVYRLNYFVGFIVSFIIYASLNYLWPVETSSGQPPIGLFKKGWYEESPEVEDFEEVFFRLRNDDASCASTGFVHHIHDV